MIYSGETLHYFSKLFQANNGRYEVAPTASFNIQRGRDMSETDLQYWYSEADGCKRQ
jgi:uncharacterized protein YccT (UPF0319 family)